MFRPASIAAAALTLGTPAYAQDRTAEIDRIFSFATPEAPGCAVGISQGGKVVVNRGYGLADVERRVPLSPNPIFDIGSTQKQFELGIRTWAQFALKYIVSHAAVTVAIPGTAKMAYLTDRLGAARGPMPDAATRRRMTTLVEAS